MAKGKLKLTFSRWDLTDEQFKWFENHSLLLQDYESCFFSPSTLADGDCGIFPIGVTLDESGCISEDVFKTYREYPKSFWKELGLPANVKKEIIAFWKTNPDGEVVWEG